MRFLLCLPILAVTIFLWYFLPPKKEPGLPVQQLTYQYHYESIGYSDAQKMYSPDSNARKKKFFTGETLLQTLTSLDCSITRVPVEKTDSSEWFAFIIGDPAITFNHEQEPIDTRQLALQLSDPFFAEILPSGRVCSVKTKTNTGSLASGFVRTIISQFQFIQPQGMPAEWSASEDNVFGSFAARYKGHSEYLRQREYEKTNTGYSRLSIDQPLQKIIPDSRMKIWMDSANTISRLQLSENQITFLHNDTVGATACKMNAELQSSSRAARRFTALLKKQLHSADYSHTSGLCVFLSDEDVNRMAHINTLGSETAESLLQKLNTPTINKTQKEQLAAQFTALVYLYPANCKKIGMLLEQEPYTSPRFELFSNALSSANNTEAVNVLADIIERRKKEEFVLIRLLPAFTGSTTVTDKMISTIKNIVVDATLPGPVVGTAQLALGAMAFHLQKTDVAKAEEITRFLIYHMQHSDDLQKILVLGNTGSGTVIPLLNTYIRDHTYPAAIREAAINGMRLITDNKVTSLLNTLVNGKDKIDKDAAVQTLVFRKEFFSVNNGN